MPISFRLRQPSYFGPALFAALPLIALAIAFLIATPGVDFAIAA
jgi:hypothetical protein